MPQKQYFLAGVPVGNGWLLKVECYGKKEKILALQKQLIPLLMELVRTAAGRKLSIGELQQMITLLNGSPAFILLTACTLGQPEVFRYKNWEALRKRFNIRYRTELLQSLLYTSDWPPTEPIVVTNQQVFIEYIARMALECLAQLPYQELADRLVCLFKLRMNSESLARSISDEMDIIRIK